MRLKPFHFVVPALVASCGSSSRSTATSAEPDAAVQNPDGTTPAADWTKWYPDAVAQVFPLIDGVESATSPHTMQVWSTLRTKYPSWITPPEPDGSPWALTGYAAAVAGSRTLADAYVAGVESAYTAQGRPWPWQVAESGWFIRTNALLAQ